MNEVDKKIQEIEQRKDILKSNYEDHGYVAISGSQIVQDEELLLRELKKCREENVLLHNERGLATALVTIDERKRIKQLTKEACKKAIYAIGDRPGLGETVFKEDAFNAIDSAEVKP